MNTKFGFDPRTLNYYQETKRGKRRVSRESVLRDVESFTLGVQQKQRELSNQLANGAITSQQWYDESARLMKLSYRAAMDAARGSSAEPTEEEKNRWLEVALILLLLLNFTADALEEDELPITRLPSIMVARGAAVRSIFKNWSLGLVKSAGFTEARRVLGIAEHCNDSADRKGCIELAAQGWIPIDRFVPFGGATCRDHCKCSFEFR